MADEHLIVVLHQLQPDCVSVTLTVAPVSVTGVLCITTTIQMHLRFSCMYLEYLL